MSIYYGVPPINLPKSGMSSCMQIHLKIAGLQKFDLFWEMTGRLGIERPKLRRGSRELSYLPPTYTSHINKILCHKSDTIVLTF